MATAILLPDGDVSAAWTDGTGSAPWFTEIDEDVESPDDANYIQKTEGANNISRFTFSNLPGDWASTNTITLKIRHRGDSFIDDNDFIRLQMYASGTFKGGQKDCAHSETILNESFTDGVWDSLTEADQNDIEVEVKYIKSTTAMADAGRNLKMFALSILLDYNTAGGDPEGLLIGGKLIGRGILGGRLIA